MNFIKTLKKIKGTFKFLGHQKHTSRTASTEYTSEMIPENHNEIKENLKQSETIVEKVRKLGGF